VKILNKHYSIFAPEYRHYHHYKDILKDFEDLDFDGAETVDFLFLLIVL